MAYIFGIISLDEARTLIKDEWELEPPPAELVPDDDKDDLFDKEHPEFPGLPYDGDQNLYAGVWCDASMFQLIQE